MRDMAAGIFLMLWLLFTFGTRGDVQSGWQDILATAISIGAWVFAFSGWNRWGRNHD